LGSTGTGEEGSYGYIDKAINNENAEKKKRTNKEGRGEKGCIPSAALKGEAGKEKKVTDRCARGTRQFPRPLGRICTGWRACGECGQKKQKREPLTDGCNKEQHRRG